MCIAEKYYIVIQNLANITNIHECCWTGSNQFVSVRTFYISKTKPLPFPHNPFGVNLQKPWSGNSLQQIFSLLGGTVVRARVGVFLDNPLILKIQKECVILQVSSYNFNLKETFFQRFTCVNRLFPKPSQAIKDESEGDCIPYLAASSDIWRHGAYAPTPSQNNPQIYLLIFQCYWFNINFSVQAEQLIN